MRVMVITIMLCAWIATASAQPETDLSVLPSTLAIDYVSFSRSILNCQCLKINPSLLGEERRLALSLDIPVNPSWDTVSISRIQDHTIQFGVSDRPWKDEVTFGGWPLPRIVFEVPDFRAMAEGGVLKTSDASLSRRMGQARVDLEGNIWYALIGVDGFFGDEQIHGIPGIVNFDTDFHRESQGGSVRLGLKVGDFDRNFIAGRYGRGYVRTEGMMYFNVPGIDDLEWFSLYFEEFKTISLSIEGKIKVKQIRQSVEFNRSEYTRVNPSPDPLRFGENRLEDVRLRLETEVTPFTKASFLRGVVVLTKDFRDQNRLMFMNEYSSLRVFVRLTLD